MGADRGPCVAYLALLAGLTAVLPDTAHADPVPPTTPLTSDPWTPPKHDPVVWRDDLWTRVKPWEDVMTIALALGSGVVSEATVSPTHPRWTGPILFDTAARNTFRLSSDKARSEAGVASDVMYYGNTFYPVLVDVAAVTLIARHSPDAAWEEFSIDAEAFAISGLVAAATQRFVARERPFVKPCQAHPNNDDCAFTPGVENVSFLSGHEAMSFTGAMLTCFHHRYLHLYDSKAADAGICAALLATATTTGFLRMMSDRHYASDVLAGSAVGLTVGYFVPAAHYTVMHPHILGEQTLILPNVSANQGGLTLMGTF